MEESWRHTASDTEYAHNWLPLLHFSPNSCSPCSPNIFCGLSLTAGQSCAVLCRLENGLWVVTALLALYHSVKTKLSEKARKGLIRKNRRLQIEV